MYIFEVSLILSGSHQTVVHSLQRVGNGLGRIRQYSGLSRLYGLLLLLHTVETLISYLGVLVKLLQQVLADSYVHSLFGRDAVDQALTQFIGAPRYVLCILLCILIGSQDHVLVLIGGILELCRLDRPSHPFFTIGISGSSHFLTTEFVFALA